MQFIWINVWSVCFRVKQLFQYQYLYTFIYLSFFVLQWNIIKVLFLFSNNNNNTIKSAWMYVYFITYNIPQSSVWWIELVPEQSEKGHL